MQSRLFALQNCQRSSNMNEIQEIQPTESQGFVRLELPSELKIASEEEIQSDTEWVVPELNLKETFLIPSALENIETLWEWLNEESVGTIGIQGDSLTGKTWTARQLMHKAVAANQFDITVWVEGARNSYEVQMQIANQLEQKLDDNYWVAADVNERKLRENIINTLAEKRFLLILDDVPSCSLIELGVPDPKDQNKSSKVVLTIEAEPHFMIDKIQQLKKLSRDEAWLLFKKIMSIESFLDNDSLNTRELVEPLLDNCKGNPLGIVTLAGTLRNLQSESSSSSSLLRSKLTADIQKASDLILNPSKMPRGQFLCEMLSDNRVRDCFFFCCIHPVYYQFSVNGLIASWIKAGFLDGFDCLEKTYKKGHDILQELIDRHLLIGKFEGMILVQTQLINEICEYIMNRGFDIQFPKRLSLAGGTGVNQKQQGLISLKNPNLLLSYSDNTGSEKSSLSLLLHGNKRSLPRRLPDKFFEQMPHLKDVQLVHVGISSLPESLSKLNQLDVLVIRGCIALENVDQIKGLKNLRVLSLSGASRLKDIPDNFFEHMVGLESLDLSRTALKQLPSSFSNLFNIRFLILGGCSNLETIPSMKKFHSLYLLDLSGASVLATPPETPNSLLMLDLSGTPFDRLPSVSNHQDLEYLVLRGCTLIKTVPHPYAFPQLKVLDLLGASSITEFEGPTSETNSSLVKLDISETKIARVPLLSKCVKLRELLVRNCPKLETLPSFGSELHVLDLSGSSSFNFFQAESLESGFITLDLSRTRIDKVTMEAANLSQLFLKECQHLEKLPHLEFPNLQVLDLSGSTNFKDVSLDKLCRLGTLNLSETQVFELPTLSECYSLRQILLRKCLCIKSLPELKALTKLEVLDVCGATSFKQFQDDSFGVKQNFRELNLSGTQVEQVPILSGCHNLSKLLLRACKNLKYLPPLEALKRLQVLDLSGSSSFTAFQDQCFRSKSDLEKVDISETLVEELPSLSECLNLSQLLVRNCTEFQTLPHLSELKKLELLDLSGDTSFCQFKDRSFVNNFSLQRLDISGTGIVEFSFLSECKNLSQLILRRCSNLETLSFEGMHKLQMLDLSGSEIERLPKTISDLHILRQLLLRGCSRLTEIPQLELLKGLELLDLSCTTMRHPAGISELHHLQFLRLSNRTYIWVFEGDDTSELTKILHCDPGGVEESGVPFTHVAVRDTGIFLFIEENLELLGNIYEKFHFCLCSVDEWKREEDIYLQKKEFVFRDMYYQTIRIPQSTDEPSKFFKICGFQNFPHGIERVLGRVELLYLKKNDFLTRLRDVGALSLQIMTECWIERCSKMEYAFHEADKKEDNLALGKVLQNLCISNLSALKCLFWGVMPPSSFEHLKHIYVECCPSLVTMFSSYLELKNLETLKIKYCDELKKIYDDQTVLGENCLPKLRTLVLWKLPKLETICGGVFPSLKNIKVSGCPKLHKVPVAVSR